MSVVLLPSVVQRLTTVTVQLQSDTVAEALAKKLNVSKSELLSRDADRYKSTCKILLLGHLPFFSSPSACLHPLE